VDWMVDRIPEKFLANHYPSRLSINYLKETGLGENVLIRHSEEPPAQFRFEGLQKSKNVVAFRGELEF
jgi:acyl-ACP thioesterase